MRRTTERRAARRRRGEEGSILILVLVFMIAVGLTCTALAGLSSNSLQSATALQNARNAQYAAESGIETAIQVISYESNNFATTGPCLPDPGGQMFDNFDIVVTCSAVSGAPPAEREIELDAATCDVGGTGCSAPIVRADVEFSGASGSRPVIIASWAVNEPAA